MAFSRAGFITRDVVRAFLAAIGAAVAVYWATGWLVPKLDIQLDLAGAGLFTLEQWEERYMRTMFIVCALGAGIAFAWALLGSAVWRGLKGDGRLLWWVVCAAAGVASFLLGWLNLPPLTVLGGNTALLLQSAAGVATVWLATLLGSPVNFRFTPLGGRWVRSRLPW